jgi:hypothetical protein
MTMHSRPKNPPGHADPDEYQRFLMVAEEVVFK